MTEPLVSVKMITYNHAPFIAQAIEGVLRQKTNFPFELVIGEDCSRDGTREIVFEYQKKYPDIIRVITSDKNVGMKKNGLRTVKACRGKYLAFCEGDDYWHNPDKLQKQIVYMESHPECGMVLADCDVYYPYTKRIIRCFNQNKGFKSETDLTIEEIISGGMVKFTCTVLANLHLYNEIVSRDPYLHQSDNFMMGDMQAWAEISLVSKVRYFPESLGTYNVLSESATRSKNMVKHYRFFKSVAEMKVYLCKKHNLSEDCRRYAESFWWDSSLRLAFYERNAELANEVKERKQTFTWKEWIRYYGARNAGVHYSYKLVSAFFGIFYRGNKEWP